MKTAKILKTVLILSLFIQSFLFASTDYPQNIILIIVDGGGFTHIDAIDYYQYGKKGGQNFEKFPVRLAVTTYPAGGSYDPNKAAQDFNYVKTGLITDSAAAATALAAGVKTSNGTLGLDVNDIRLENVIEKCEKLGIATGVVTTVEITDATPAGFVAHAKSRRDYEQIADEMINKSALEVIFGCGNPFFDDDGKKLDKPGNFKYVGSKKIWDSLVKGTAGADADGDKVADKWTLIQSRQDFISLADGNTPKRIIGIAQAATTLQEKRSGDSTIPFNAPPNQNVPNLSEMTKAALNVLDDDNDGFFIMVEAGAVDWASHGNSSARMIEEMRDFTRAADAVIDWVQTKSSWQKTLVIITSDHQTGYLTNVLNSGSGTLPPMRWNSKDHTKSLVFLFAKGQGSELFEQQAKGKDLFYGSFIDNTDIAKVIFALLERRVSVKK
ncbi:MAG: alkaline phosphatase [Sedimentisphaerales bacterium]